MCGKDTERSLGLPRRTGSPPHVRERQSITILRARSCRITPACAGKTRRIRFMLISNGDHPRMCGKDQLWTRSAAGLAGSPPHVRERLRSLRIRPPRLRITPACAGKTSAACWFVTANQDHPRMCGKDLMSSNRIPRRAGSPPHVRERPESACCRNRLYRITPACAGKTNPAGCWPRRR